MAWPRRVAQSLNRSFARLSLKARRTDPLWQPGTELSERRFAHFLLFVIVPTSMADDTRSLAPRRRPHRPILVVANPSPDSDSDSAHERSLQRFDGHLYGRNAPPSPSQPSPSIDKSFHVQLASSREPGPLTTTNLPSSHFRQHPASQSNPALSSPSGTSSPPPSTPGQSLPPSDFVADAPTKLDFSFGPSNSSDALAQQHVPLHTGTASHLLGKIKAHIPRINHDRRLSNTSRTTSVRPSFSFVAAPSAPG